MFDLISIGDNATDAFIRLSEAELHCDINKEECKICMRFASKIPYESVTVIPSGGNSSNIAIGASKLGLATAYLSNVGDDENGKQTTAKLQSFGIDTSFVKINKGKATNYNYVLWYDGDRTILVKHEDYCYDSLPDIGSPKWIFLSSLGDNSLELHYSIARFIEAHPETKLAFSPGTMQIREGYEKLSDLYKFTNVFFSNKQEAGKILKTEDDDIERLASGIKALGPQKVIITDSDRGAWALDGSEFWHVPAFPIKSGLVERTGAGDAFSSAFMAAIIGNKGTSEALVWGAINSASVVQKIGPHDGLLGLPELNSTSQNLPEDFKIESLEASPRLI